ncbi:uncharacterized protein LOC128960046 [Oppia nitens]|uniref:uncharacterized protein LOC128960046 n=1 Tax=Oppia nitens TaxID=1686743 RepID=UPI0023DCA7C4|nr:uncharacterized protein LOC128960046 [Oppia nitens]
MSYIKRFLGKLSTIPALLIGTAFSLDQTIGDIDDRRHCRRRQHRNAWLRNTYMINTDGSGGDGNIDINPDWIRSKCYANVALVFCLNKDEVNLGENSTVYGTGICIDAANQLFLTNAHVVGGHEVVFMRLITPGTIQMTCYWSVEEILLPYLPVDVLYVEDHNDLALIKRRDHPPEYEFYEAIKLVDREPQFGELVAAYGNGNCYYTVFSGMIRESGSFGIPISDYNVDKLSFTMDEPHIIHSATIVKGCSGGPLIDSEANCIGINFAGYYIKSCAKTSKTMISFLERGLHYVEYEFLWKVIDRRNIYSMGTASDRKLGLLLEKTSNGFTVRDHITNADTNIHEGQVIRQVKGQPFLNIRQMRTALAELSTDSPKVKLIVSTDTEDIGLTLNANLTGDEFPLVF